jgi:hypothetical protein
MEFDAEDVGLLVLGVFSSAVMVGLATVQAFDVSLSDSFTLAGFDLTLAYLISAGTFVGTILTNDNAEVSLDLWDDIQSSNMDAYYIYAIAGTALLLVGWAIIPDVGEFFQSADLWGVVYIGIVTTGQLAIGYMY